MVYYFPEITANNFPEFSATRNPELAIGIPLGIMGPGGGREGEKLDDIPENSGIETGQAKQVPGRQETGS